jgi:GNAT superfamily N-acetyltransferase
VAVVSDVVLAAADPAGEEARWAMASYFAELAARFPHGFDPGDALDEAASEYRAPTGLFVLAHDGAEAVACGALLHLDGATAEIKRMWVRPSHRGRGLATRLLAHLEAEAAAAGRTCVILDTNGVLTEAIALYRARGYTPIERYNDNPYAEHWFAKDLPPAR